MIVDGKKIANDIISQLSQERGFLPPVLRLGVLMGAQDVASASFVKIKERIADKLQVVVVREELSESATTAQALRSLDRLSKNCAGVIVQMPLPSSVDIEEVLAGLSPNKDVDGVTKKPLVSAPVSKAISEVFMRTGLLENNPDARSGPRLKRRGKTVVVGAGKLVGIPAADLLKELGAEVSVVTHSRGSLGELKDADIVVLGTGEPGLIKPEMLKKGVVLIDAGTSEAVGKLAGDADPLCAEVASIFTPVPGGIGPIAVAMIFKNLFILAKNTPK